MYGLRPTADVHVGRFMQWYPKLPVVSGFGCGEKQMSAYMATQWLDQAPSQQQRKEPVVIGCAISFGETGLLTDELFPSIGIYLTELWLGSGPGFTRSKSDLVHIP